MEQHEQHIERLEDLLRLHKTIQSLQNKMKVQLETCCDTLQVKNDKLTASNTMLMSIIGRYERKYEELILQIGDMEAVIDALNALVAMFVCEREMYDLKADKDIQNVRQGEREKHRAKMDLLSQSSAHIKNKLNAATKAAADLETRNKELASKYKNKVEECRCLRNLNNIQEKQLQQFAKKEAS
ncbi:uncharacterized protein LOC115633332 [Scaptodrosophila lebanonensis]|uniref:Uncharacterized protein LOC115633332 n=1 Tax=Drosophila lebanonensis TaxID=7225 RepID=A0A6J2UE35_DROLE|nr:uncharacterized protein LOC115633332 [Scaptodrosophila lebanonensis]